MNNIEAVIKDLKEIYDKAKEDLRVDRYDFTDESAVHKLKKYTDNLFKDRIRMMKDLRSSDFREAIAECTQDVLARRKTAVLNLAAETGRRLNNRFLNLNAAEEFVKLNAPIGPITFNALNKSSYIELAAAIWILDHLLENNKLDDALVYLPESRDDLDSVFFPDINDSVHCDDIIKGILYVIRNRNRGVEGFDGKKAFIDSAQARGAHTQTKDRQNYEGIIHLIDTDTINDKREMFTASVLRTADSLSSILSEYQSEINALNINKMRIIEKLFESFGREGLLRSDSVLNFDRSVGTISFSENHDGLSERLLPEALRVRGEIAGIDEKINSVALRKESLYLSFPIITPNHAGEFRGIADDKLIDKIPGIATSDPYAYCFAFLNLLDTDSDYIWIYNISLFVMASVCESLPWAESTAMDEESDAEIDPSFISAALEKSDQYVVSPENSILNRRIISPPYVASDGEQISFAQLVFLVAGLIPPRRLTGMSYMKALFENSGLSEDEINILYEYLVLAYSLSQRDANYVFVDEDDEQENVQSAETEKQSDDFDGLQAQLKALKQENKKLKGLVNRLEHRVNEYAREAETTGSELEKAYAELAELRSMIRKTESSDEEFTSTVAFPYTSKKRAVVFGGHESWAKAIRPLLKNVRFVDASAQPNVSLIMNADVVWIQTNAISHSSFYKIIDVIRKHHIELRYFKYSSAEKCAEQFALEDIEDPKETEPEE